MDNPKFPRICRTIREYKEGEGRKEMCTIVEEYGKKQRDVGLNTGRKKGRRELINAVLLLKSGKDKQQLKRMGYDDSTIEDAYLLL